MLEPRLLSRIENKKKQLDRLRPLPHPAVARLREQILVEWIYNSNAIEGSTITLKETRLILETGLTIGGKSLREHFEVINHRDAIDYVESLVDSRSGSLLFMFARFTNWYYPVLTMKTLAISVKRKYRLPALRLPRPNPGRFRT